MVLRQPPAGPDGPAAGAGGPRRPAGAWRVRQLLCPRHGPRHAAEPRPGLELRPRKARGVGLRSQRLLCEGERRHPAQLLLLPGRAARSELGRRDETDRGAPEPGRGGPQYRRRRHGGSSQ